jgi:hypothetical protein
MITLPNSTLKERFKKFELKIKQNCDREMQNETMPVKFTHKCEALPPIKEISDVIDIDDDIFSSIDCDVFKDKQQDCNNVDSHISDILIRLKEDSQSLKNLCTGIKLSRENRNKLVDVKTVIDVLLNE